MNINHILDKNFFSIKERGNKKLINPKISDGDSFWKYNNLFLRSVIFEDNKIVSASWPKFFNINQCENVYPKYVNFNDYIIENKEDGSTIIISKYKNQLICRTRGTFDAFEHETGEELKEILDKNPKFIDNEWVNSEQISLLFEHLSIKNRIIIKHERPKLVLIGAIKHKNYEILNHAELDLIAKQISAERPKKFSFDSIFEIIKNCETLKNAEGYVVSYNNNQNRIKVKGRWYLHLHRFKSAISSFDKVLDLFIELGKPSFDEFYNYVLTTFDYELAEEGRAHMREACNGFAMVQETLKEINAFVAPLKDLTRKDAALVIMAQYKDLGLDSYAFSLLNGKLINDKQIKNLIIGDNA